MTASSTPGRDSSREALIDAATEVFARDGYYDATLRAIAQRANANVALVKYHFGDKLGLYTEVLRSTVLRAGHALIPAIAAHHAPPERVLRELVHVLVHNILGTSDAERSFALLAHELARPTPVLPQLVREIIQPNYDRLRGLIGAILRLPPDSEKTCLCTLSIVAQIIMYARVGSFVRLLRPPLPLTKPRLNRIADHVADFSLAYLQAARAA
jgi:AcrR family transcriptional regulator